MNGVYNNNFLTFIKEFYVFSLLIFLRGALFVKSAKDSWTMLLVVNFIRFYTGGSGTFIIFETPGKLFFETSTHLFLTSFSIYFFYNLCESRGLSTHCSIGECPNCHFPSTGVIIVSHSVWKLRTTASKHDFYT